MYIQIGDFPQKYNLTVIRKGFNPMAEMSDEASPIEVMKKNLTIIVTDDNMDKAVEDMIFSFNNDTVKVIKVFNEQNELVNEIPYTEVYSVNLNISELFNRIEILLGW